MVTLNQSGFYSKYSLECMNWVFKYPLATCMPQAKLGKNSDVGLSLVLKKNMTTFWQSKGDKRGQTETFLSST